jgi:glutathione synthase/RimK-type ligase-like ATP-grasp enzyme
VQARPRVLILSAPDDEHVPFLFPPLEQLGADYLWFDPARYPSEATVSARLTSAGVASKRLRTDDAEFDLAEFTGVWYRRPGEPVAGPEVAAESHRRFVELTSARFLEGLWELMECPWLPATPSVEKAADNKLVQLSLAAQLGFAVPETLITNDPLDFLHFSELEDALVSKSLVNSDVLRDAVPHVVLYTHPVRRRDWMAFDRVRHGPVIFQTYVPKDVEVRATVVGDRVFAAEIASQESRTTRHDWRRYDDPWVRVQAHELPEEVAGCCVRLVAALGLTFGALDLVLTPDGEYVFLEANGNGQWGFVELRTGLPIAKAIAELLTASARPPFPTASHAV